ncbi:MAG TPA: hypothetical protein VFJ77_02505 [Gaiellaceae bacterium]|nr:hypothetical protein [Gaiellaceae bacterium]
MRRIALLGVVALALLPLGRSAERTLPLRGPQAATATLTALLGDSGGSRLATVDPATLAARVRSARLGPVDAWAVAPGGGLVALGVRRDPDADSYMLRFANAATLRVARAGVPLSGWLQSLLWASPGRVVALTGEQDGVTVAVVDAVAKRVVARHPLGGMAAAVARFRGGLAALVQPGGSVGAAKLAVVGPSGEVRSVRLERIRAGAHWPEDPSSDPIGTTRQPALAVDPAGTAYVLDPDGLVAEIDLRSLAVSYHTLGAASVLARIAAWLVPPASAKGMNGPQRAATWLGDGLIALSGSDYSATRAEDGSVTFSQAPAGLAVVDTHGWTVRTLDRQATSAWVADGALLATGGGWSSGDSARGEGLAAYGPDGKLRWRLFPGTRPWVDGVVGGLALVVEEGGARFHVVDVESGRILRSGPLSSEPRVLAG